MEANQVLSKIKKGEIAPVYVLYGTQTLLMDELIEELKKQLLTEADMDFNYEQFDLEDVPIGQVVEACETFPFLGEKRLIVASNAFFLTGAKVQQHVEHHLESLERYLEQPADFSVLVLKVEHEKLDERKKIVKNLKKQGILCSCLPLNQDHLLSWLESKAAELSVHVKPEALELLVQYVGQEMDMLSNELVKMAQYVGKQGIITAETVQELIAKQIEQDVFALVEHVVQLRLTEAFTLLHELLKRREEPIKIVLLIARQFRLIYRAKDLANQGYSPAQMSSYLRLPPFVCRMVVRQSNQFTEKQLRTILDWIAETDFLLKTGKMDKVLALEVLLLKIKDLQTAKPVSSAAHHVE